MKSNYARAFDILFLLGSIALGLSSCSSAPQLVQRSSASTYSEPFLWLQYGASSELLARLITYDATCPTLRLEPGARPLEMKVRAKPDSDFPVLVCEAMIPEGTRGAHLETIRLPIPEKMTRKVVVLGDTGCRIKAYGDVTEAQGCNDSQAWPFAKVSRSAAAENPDMIVHLGDYHYRESPCPPDNASCEGSPWGYGWDTWNADFFQATRPLLLKAPWIFVRGNHESCKRAGEGWFRFFEPGSYAACTDKTQPYLVKRGGAEFVVLDSALATDLKEPDAEVEMYRRQLGKIAQMPLRHAWLVTHKPFWSPVLKDPTRPDSPMDAFNHVLQKASGNKLPSGISAIFAGHLHTFQELHFEDGRADQFVIGNSGSSLTPSAFKEPAGLEIAGTKVTSGSTLDDYGYFTLHALKKGQWEGAAHDADGVRLMKCVEKQKRLTCAPL